jgi:vacuolar protein sorting-associated protein 35
MDAVAPVLTGGGDEQERWLHEAFKAVKTHAFYMRRALVSSHCVSCCDVRTCRAAPPPLSLPATHRPSSSQDEGNLRDALKHSAAMLGELRTSLLSPQKYYSVYMRAFDELRHLEAFFVEENKRGRSNAELYELVQHAGNILPRM